MQVSSGLESPRGVLEKTLRTEDHPNCSQNPGQVLGPHDPSCNSLVLYYIFVLYLRAEHVLYSYVLHFRPEAELYVELSRLSMRLHIQVTHKCWTSSRIDEF